MGTTTDEIRREVDATRGDLDEKIDVLEQRAQASVRRIGPMVAGAGVTIFAIAAAAFVFYRSRRRPPLSGRLAGMVPEPLWRLRDATELRVRRGIPPTRIFIGDRQVVGDPPSSGWQKIALRLAQSAGTAAGSALVAYGLRTVTRPNKPAAGGPTGG